MCRLYHAAKVTIKKNSLADELKAAHGEQLEPKYKDHSLKGEFKGLRDCHVKPNLVLIYSKNKTALLLTAFRISSHSELF